MTLAEYEKSYSEYLTRYYRVLLWDTEEHYRFHIEKLTECLSHNPENPFALNTRGLAYIETGNGNSINDFYSSIRISEHPVPYTNLGDLFSSNNRQVEAVECYSKAVALAPEEPTTYRLRTKPLIALGDIESAISDYSKAIELQPGNVYDLMYRGELYQRLGKISLAEEDRKAREDLEKIKRREGQDEEIDQGKYDRSQTKSSIWKDIARIFWKK